MQGGECEMSEIVQSSLHVGESKPLFLEKISRNLFCFVSLFRHVITMKVTISFSPWGMSGPLYSQKGEVVTSLSFNFV